MKKPKISDFNKIAIIQTAFLGDVALALYLAQSIKNIHPNCHLFFVTTPAASPLASITKAVDTVITYDKRGLQTGISGIKRIANYIKELNIECIIAPHRSLRTSLLTFLSKPKYSVGFNKNSLGVIYSKRIKYQSNLHEISRNAKLLSAFDEIPIFDEKNKVQLDFAIEDEIYIDNLLNKDDLNPKKRIALAPGSIWLTKRWLWEYYSDLAKMLEKENFQVFLIGSKEDDELCNKVAKGSNATNLAGQLSLPQTLIFLSRCDLLVTNDSAPTHLAGLVKTVTFTIFGPTSPSFGFAPIGPNDKVFVNDKLKCHPCHIHGRNTCPQNTHECMKSITPNLIFSKILEII